MDANTPRDETPMNDAPGPAPYRPGDVVREWPAEDRHPAAREVYTKRNTNRRCGYDVSHETLRTCDLCGRGEWVKTLSRNTRWHIGHVGPHAIVTACPEHRREAYELERTMSQAFRELAEDIKSQVRARMDAGNTE